MRLPLILVLAAVLAMLVASRLRAAARATPPPAPLEIDRVSGELRLTASVCSTALPPDLVVASKDSPHAHSALFVSDSTCDEVRRALATLSFDGDGGDAPVALHVQWPGSGGRHPLAGILAEDEPGSARLDFRFCRNTGLASSDVGCIVRVASPGRPSSDQGTVPKSIADRLPRPGTTVVLTLRK